MAKRSVGNAGRMGQLPANWRQLEGGNLVILRAFSTTTAAVFYCLLGQTALATPLETGSIRQAVPVDILDGTDASPSKDYDVADLVPRKTLAGKILAAIALERVTGRKPDPSRFSELN